VVIPISSPVTIAAPTGQDGFTRDFATPVIVDCVLSVALAVDLPLVRLQSAPTP
jgi:hypothetical protein